MTEMFFDGWPGLIRTAVVGALAYVGLVVILRASGKRTLSKLNAFDLIVTVALGSTLATILLSKDVALAEGLVAFALLTGIQYVVTWSSVRLAWVRNLVKSEPTMLAYRGSVLHDAMRRERVTLEELEAAMRSSGLHSLEEIDAAVLETDGTLSILGSAREQGWQGIDGVRGPSDL